MRLDPEAEKVVKSFPSDSSGKPPDVSALRAATRKMNIEAGGPAIETASVQDASPEQIGSPVPLRIYRPNGLPEGAAPAMIFVHGGGWVIGDLDSYDAVCRQIADRAKCVVLSADYRLAPEHPAPAASDDVIATLQWAFAQAASLGIDRDRIAIGGDSAGGGLSASAAIAARDAGLPLRCQILIYPATDQRNLSWQYASRRRNAEIPPLTLSMMKWFSDLYLPDKTLAEDWHISPLAAADLTGVAPALILSGGADALWDDAKLYTDQLESSGVEVLRRSFPGMIHGFINMLKDLTVAEESLQTIVLFLQERLGQRP